MIANIESTRANHSMGRLAVHDRTSSMLFAKSGKATSEANVSARLILSGNKAIHG